MKTLEKTFYVAIACVLPLLAACDNELDIENDEVVLRVGETVTVDIKNAGKNCTAEVDNPNVVTATVTDGQLELYATDEGATLVRLTNEDNETEELLVTSALDLEKYIWVIKSDSRPTVIVYAYGRDDGRVTGAIWLMLERNLPYTVGQWYSFVTAKEGKSSYPGNTAEILYSFEDGRLIADDEAGGKYTCTIIQRTDESMTTQEDLTEYYQALYPDAGITDVKRKITWTRCNPFR